MLTAGEAGAEWACSQILCLPWSLPCNWRKDPLSREAHVTGPCCEHTCHVLMCPHSLAMWLCLPEPPLRPYKSPTQLPCGFFHILSPLSPTEPPEDKFGNGNKTHLCSWMAFLTRRPSTWTKVERWNSVKNKQATPFSTCRYDSLTWADLPQSLQMTWSYDLGHKIKRERWIYQFREGFSVSNFSTTRDWRPQFPLTKLMPYGPRIHEVSWASLK